MPRGKRTSPRPTAPSTTPSPSAQSGRKQISIRIPESMDQRVGALKAARQEHPPPGTNRVTRAVIWRLALDQGLAALEAEHGPDRGTRTHTEGR